MTTVTSDNNGLYFLPLPLVRVDQISGFLEAVLECGGEDSLSAITQRLHLTIDDLLPILEAVKLLGFGNISDGVVALSYIGRDFAKAKISARRWLFRQQALENVAQLAFITRTLRKSKGLEHNAEGLLKKFSMPDEAADRQFAIAVEWGRYAELFEYNANTKRLHLLPLQD